MDMKYEIIPDQYLAITNEEGREVKVHRIRALRPFRTKDGTLITKGTEGGFVEGPANLAQRGQSWISGNAIAMGTAYVAGDAHYTGNAILSKGTVVLHRAQVEHFVGREPLERRKPGEKYEVDDHGTPRMVEASGREIINAEEHRFSRLTIGSCQHELPYVPVKDELVPEIPFNRLPPSNTFSSLMPKLSG